MADHLRSRNVSFSNPSSKQLLRHLSESKLKNPIKNIINDSNRTFHFPLIDKYIKRPNTLKSLNKTENDIINKKIQSDKGFDLVISSSKIVDVKQLNDEFKKPLIYRKKITKSLSNDFYCQKDNSIKETFIPNNTLHNKFIGENVNFDKNSIEKDLKLYQRYSLYLIEIVNKRLKESNKEIITPLNAFQKPIENNQKTSHMLRNKYIIDSLEMNKYRKNVEISARAIISDLNRLEPKKLLYREVASNKFFNEVLENVFRRVKYMKSNNRVICEDNVINLIHQEVISITNNVESLLKSPAFIKNFYFKDYGMKIPSMNEQIQEPEVIEKTNNFRIRTSEKKFNLYSIKEGDDESRDEKTESKFLDLIASNSNKGKGRTESIHLESSSNLHLKFKHREKGNEITEELEEKDYRRSSFELNSVKGKNIYTSLKKSKNLNEKQEKVEVQETEDMNKRSFKGRINSKENIINNKTELNETNNNNGNYEKHTKTKQTHKIVDKKQIEENNIKSNLYKKEDKTINKTNDKIKTKDKLPEINAINNDLDTNDKTKLPSQTIKDNKIFKFFTQKDNKNNSIPLIKDNSIITNNLNNSIKNNKENLILGEANNNISNDINKDINKDNNKDNDINGNNVMNISSLEKGKDSDKKKMKDKRREKKVKENDPTMEIGDNQLEHKKEIQEGQEYSINQNKPLTLLSNLKESKTKRDNSKFNFKGNLNYDSISDIEKKNLVLRIINTGNNGKEIEEEDKNYNQVLTNSSNYNSDLDSNYEEYEDYDSEDDLYDANDPNNARRRRRRKGLKEYEDDISERNKKREKNIISPETLGLTPEELLQINQRKRNHRYLRSRKKKGTTIDVGEEENNEMYTSPYIGMNYQRKCKFSMTILHPQMS